MTYQQILDRDVPAIVATSKELANAGICGNIIIYYRHEEIVGMSEALPCEQIEADGWKDSGVRIPCNIAWSAWYNFLYQRLGNVPLFAI